MPVKVKLNGIDGVAEAGESVLSLARRNGINIPNLCQHDAVEPIGACRVCLVEIKIGNKKEINTSCNAKVVDGMEIETESAEIRQHRALNIEMLFARAPGSDALKQLAFEYGVRDTRFVPETAGDLKNCILCELCVRTCDMLGHNALAVIGRGGEKRIAPPFDAPSDSCVGCGACVSVCPTNCIEMKETRDSREIWGGQFKLVACDSCSSPLMTEKHRAFAIEKGDLAEDYYQTCITCKKKQLSSRFAQVGS